MGERRAEKPNRDDEATLTPAAAGSNYGRQACRDKEKEPSTWASRKDLERETVVQRAQEPHGGSGTAGVAEGAGWGEGRTA